ncbi:MAG: hypothetical protein EOO07_25565, partial [Chitinophagaceae bacterium]
MEYNQLFQDCDAILNRVIENGGYIEQSDAAQLTSKSGGRMKMALDQLQEDNAIEKRNQTSPYYDIRSKGREIHEMGGYKVFLQKQADDEARRKETEELTDRKMRVDLANAERVYKTYRSTRAMAILAFIFSAIGLFLSIAKAL